ncbi:MAG: hypothetical protein JWO36_791 [Myxococcales bacterium]|nr:hypothetical protein [Myxococcales bacterium]
MVHNSSYIERPNEIRFQLGDVRAFVNPPLEPEFEVSSDQFVYRADGAIRINREALLDNYEIVLRNVVRMSKLSHDDVHRVLHEIVHKVHAQPLRAT